MSMNNSVIDENETLNDDYTHASVSVQLFNGHYDEFEIIDDRTECSDKKNKTQKIDKGHHILSVKNKKGKTNKVDVFSVVNVCGNNIRDAITGSFYNIKIGSFQSGQFFILKDYTDKSIPVDHVFFYNTPEDYERHTNTELSVSIKKKWYDRYNKYNVRQ